MLIILMDKRQTDYFKKYFGCITSFFFLKFFLEWKELYGRYGKLRESTQKLLWIGDARLGSLKGGQAILTNHKEECGVNECLQRLPKMLLL